MRILLLAMAVVIVLGCQSNPPQKTPTIPENELGNQALAKGDYEGAIGYYEIWLSKYPQDADVYFQRGRAYYQLKKYEAALGDFDSAMKYYPKDISPMVYMCGALRALERDEDARKMVSAVLNHPMYSKLDEYEQFLVLYFDGHLKNLAKDYRGAMAPLNKAVELASLYPHVMENHGSPYIKCIALYQRVLSRFKTAAWDDPQQVADMEEYMKLAEKAGLVTPQDRYTLAMIYYLSHQNAKCRQVLAQLTPNEREVLGKSVEHVEFFTRN